ncbi:hypothetical protein JX265_005516 [Neoarthrinium moseri]|uniref:Diphthine--ammonia ligase n=1 Tax=Neoarthrinium moseri TaxID=1658444 RepID=A0A9P9WNR8_9PEZI|nr:hypothetical protein JX266_006649 [Neoarthrinium moseri]KAI1872636.1 hypothetical protein JX265_005516 [Neoarthrinium moseri]
MAPEALNVIALVSGGKDSFFSALHCLANGHRIVALANLHPPESTTARVASVAPGAPQHGSPLGSGGTNDHHLDGEEDETDLNSFMYQTVGHQAIPLYAAATGLPLFRQAIIGTTLQHGVSYQGPQLPTSTAGAPDSGSGPQPGAGQGLEDETESLVPLLRAVIADHPEANALCTGAILSTYQRTRIESVALRLGLVPLAYLWQYPVLPLPTARAEATAGIAGDQSALRAGTRDRDSSDDDAQLLRDMADVGLEARIVKVASAGLDEDFLWENVATDRTVQRMKRALRRFGGGDRGSVLGEGGEFETLVLDGPPALFKGRIVVGEAGRRVVREGGGSTWLSIRDARVELKAAPQGAAANGVRIPELLDPRFQSVLDGLQTSDLASADRVEDTLPGGPLPTINVETRPSTSHQWCYVGKTSEVAVTEQTAQIIAEIRQQLSESSLTANAITNSIIILRHMSDFPTINQLYGSLFTEPNPPARVTISCGDLLPPESQIAIYLTVNSQLPPNAREGLHVQSRSYWAPANIGPYSQAITFPLNVSHSGAEGSYNDHGTKAITIAGQIPLLPAPMVFPPDSPDAVAMQITLSLQHLWRIGLEMRTQWWSGAVAYFPRASSSATMKQMATLTAQAWRTTHLWSVAGVDSDDEGGPDLWDRTYNPQFMTLASADQPSSTTDLPDWESLRGFDIDDDQKTRPIPYVFAAEVQELPRGAGVEWHAHLGLAKVSPGSISVVNSTYGVVVSDCNGSLEIQHVVVDNADGLFIHTTAAFATEKTAPLSSLLEGVTSAVADGIKNTLETTAGGQLQGEWANVPPYLSYTDANGLSSKELDGHQSGEQSPFGAVIPCHSLWNAQGDRLKVVALFQNHFAKPE